MIEVENLTKKYGNHVAVDNLSFRVEKGMIYGFLGPNGAGKSTTMNMMTGYIAATSGSVKINGYDILKDPEKAKKCIGYLPELPPVYQDMTVYEYLKFAAELKQVKKSERKQQIEDIMKQTRIDDVRDRLIKNLSKGYKQRVGLDPKQIIEIRELIRELAKKHTIILSSHILSEVSAVCDHIMIISKGKLVASDTPERLMDMLNGEKRLQLSVAGEQDKLEEIFKGIPEIKEYKFMEPKEEGCVSVDIQTVPDTDIRKKLFYDIVKADMPIMELSLSERSLEDVFLELTGDNNDSNTNEEQIVQKEEADKNDSNI